MKILWISDSIHLYTGFGIQSYLILKELQSLGHSVHSLGWFAEQNFVHEGIPVTALYQQYNDISIIYHKYKEINPDVVISLGDLKMIHSLITDIQDISFYNKWLHWLPVDGEPYPTSLNSVIQQLPHIVTMSNFGYNLYHPNYRGQLDNIFLGINTKHLKCLPDKNKIKKRNRLSGQFVCLWVGKNQWRKNIPALLEGFKKFAQNKTNVRLLLHTELQSLSGYNGYNITELVEQNDLVGKVIISPKRLNGNHLNKLYNSADIFVSASSSEGFGLPYVEAMFAGLPLLIPNYTTGKEFVTNPDCGQLIDISEYDVSNDTNIKRAIINTNDMASKLNYFYKLWQKNDPIINSYSQVAKIKAKNNYDIKNIALQWHKLIISKTTKLKHIEKQKWPYVLFIEDFGLEDVYRGSQLSTDFIINCAEDFNINARLLTLKNINFIEIKKADIIILGNIVNLLIQKTDMVSHIIENKKFIRWEHDFNFCGTRDNRCSQNMPCSNSTDCRKKIFQNILAKAQSVIFQSPGHQKLYLDAFDLESQDKLVLPPPIDVKLFNQTVQEREKEILFIGSSHPLKGLDNLIQEIKQKPQQKYHVILSPNTTTSEHLSKLSTFSNCRVEIKEYTNQAISNILNQHETFYYKPIFFDASSRMTAEALLCGCNLITNNKVGINSYNWPNKHLAERDIKNSPSLFWQLIKNQYENLEDIKDILQDFTKTRIIFFPSHTIELPSSHIRVFTVSEELEKLNIETIIVNPRLSEQEKSKFLKNCRPSDIIYVQKTFNTFHRSKYFKKCLGTLVYDVDDFYEERSGPNRNYPIVPMFNSDAMSRIAQCVIVGSHRLKKWNSKNNRNITVISSMVDNNVYNYLQPKQIKQPNEITILWSSKKGHAHLDDLFSIKDVLIKLYEKYKFKLILQSFETEQQIEKVLEKLPFAECLKECNLSEYFNDRVPLMHTADIFITPMNEDDMIKSCKSGQNSRHMMGMGIPGVASPTAEHDFFIQDDVNGFLAKTNEEWHNKLEQLIINNELRLKMSNNAAESIYNKYSRNTTAIHLLKTIHPFLKQGLQKQSNISISGKVAFVTTKYKSSGGGTITASHIISALQSLGYNSYLLHKDPSIKSKKSFTQINEHVLSAPKSLQELIEEKNPEVIFFDDIPRVDLDIVEKIEKSYLILCGCLNVHTEYFSSPIIFKHYNKFKRIFVKNQSLANFLIQQFGSIFTYWQGGIDGPYMRQTYGRSKYIHPKDGSLLSSSFSKGWWKNPYVASVIAGSIIKKYPKTKYYKPCLNEQDLRFCKNRDINFEGPREKIPREQLLQQISKSQLAIEPCLVDAFPRTLLDYFSFGIPVITTSTLSFLNEYDILKEHLIVTNSNDMLSMYNKALLLLENQNIWTNISNACIEFTNLHSQENEKQVLLRGAGLL